MKQLLFPKYDIEMYKICYKNPIIWSICRKYTFKTKYAKICNYKSMPFCFKSSNSGK